MQPQPEVAAGGGDGGDFVDGVDASRFGRLRDADGARLGVVVVVMGRRDDADRAVVELPIGGRRDKKLRAVREEFRRAALGRLDVRERRADHRMVALAERGQSQRIRGRAIEDEENLAFPLEEAVEGVDGPAGPDVVAVGRRMAQIGFEGRGPGFRADAGVIVAREILDHVRHG